MFKFLKKLFFPEFPKSKIEEEFIYEEHQLPAELMCCLGCTNGKRRHIADCEGRCDRRKAFLKMLGINK